MKNYTVEFLDIEHIECQPIPNMKQYPDMAQYLGKMQELRLSMHHGRIEAEQKKFDNIGLIVGTFNRYFKRG